MPSSSVLSLFLRGFPLLHEVHEDQTIRVYVNRGSDDWEIPVGRILLARNMLTVADDQLVLGHNGFCILEDE